MIHVLGAGNIGCLFAVSLARRSPVELLLKPSRYREYVNFGKSMIELRTGGAVFEQSVAAREIGDRRTQIKKLVVAVKSHDVLAALRSVQPQLTPDSEILIFHNGMGVLEQLESNWEGRLPRLAFGVTDAGVKRDAPLWKFDYTGHGTATVSSRDKSLELFEDLRLASEFVVTEPVDWHEFTLRQKRKLAANSAINALTALVQCENGMLEGSPLAYRVVKETCAVLELNLPETWDLVEDVIRRTAKNTSSMLRDVENGYTPEIEFINGYIVREAHRHGQSALLNQMLCDLVEMRVQQVRKELAGAIPLVSG